MSGGSQQQQQPAYQPALDPRVLQAFPGTPTDFTIPQAMPGQLEAVASQLTDGFGGDFLADLDNLYAPTTYQTYGREGPPAGKPASKEQAAATPAIDPSLLFKALHTPNPNSMPVEQWLSFINNPSRLPFGSYAGMNYQGP
jgi:hypothetical protein